MENTSGEEGTVLSDGGFFYTDNLNVVNEGQFIFSGSGETKRSLIEMGSNVRVKRNGTLEFRGLVDDIEFFDGGAMAVHASGYEVWLAKENGDYAGSPWTATISEDIFIAVLGEASQPSGAAWSAGTVEAGPSIDFRANVSDSLYNVIKNLRRKTAKDIGIDYPNLEIDILDHKGSSSSVETLNSGIQIGDVAISKSYPIGNDIRVYGKGDGDNQIKSDPAQGQDAGSKATYGTIRYVILDRTITSVAEANLLANAEVARLKDPRKIYNFDVFNPAKTWVSGDVLTINAPSQEVSAEEVRIVSLKRGIRNNEEFLEAEVTNKEFSEKTKTRDEVIAEIDKKNRDKSYMDGTTNILTFSDQINANNSAPLRVVANLPTSLIFDEISNRRVNSFTLDYDVDPFRSNVESSSTSDNSATGAGITNASAVTGAGITNAVQGSPDAGYSLGPYTDTSWSDNTSWQDVNTSVNIGGFTYSWHAGWMVVRLVHDSSSVHGGISMRLKNTTDTTYWPDSNGIKIMRANYISNTQPASAYGLIVVPRNWTSKNYIIQMKTDVTGITRSAEFGYYGIRGHTHSNSFNDTSHTNNNSFNDANHNHSVSVGDGVSDSGSTNATQVNIYVDFWNGSSWVNKHSILNTGKTIDTDVDISNGNTLPDAAGFWRVRILTDNATPDLVIGIVKVKHELDT